MKKVTGFLSGFDWLSAFFAGIWLVFLFFPASTLWGNPSYTLQTKLAGTSLLILFTLVYLLSYGANSLIPAKKQWQRTLVWSLLLLVPVLLMWFLIGFWALYLGTYFVALWCFQEKPQIGLPAGLGITAVITVTMLGTSLDLFQGGGYGFLIAASFIMVMSLLAYLDDRRGDMQSRLLQAQTSEKIARDVHDILGHTLTVINLKAELAAALINREPDTAQQEMQQVAELSRTALAEVRATVTRMKHPSFAGEIQAARRALETAHITAQLPAEPLPVSGPNAALFSWALREAITNVIRHSQASHCWVRVSADRLEIIDDGKGQDISPGNGLSGLAQRVHEAGGDLLVETSPLTRVLVTMNGDTSPLKEQAP